MKKIWIIILLLGVLPSITFSDDEGWDYGDDYSSDWSYTYTEETYTQSTGDNFFWSYYPSDTQSSDQGYYTVSGYQNASVYEPVYIHTPYNPPKPTHDTRTPPKPTPKPTPKPEPKHDTRTPPKPTPKPEPKHHDDEDGHKNTYHKEETVKEYHPTQSEKERRAEKEYYDTHTHGFPKHVVFNDYTGKWECSRGYISDANHHFCIEVKVPANAEYTANTRGWECNRGFTISADQMSCNAIVVPKNAKLNAKGNAWECNKWYFLSTDGLSCRKAYLPPHASQNIFTGEGWSCDFGYVMQKDYSCKK